VGVCNSGTCRGLVIPGATAWLYASLPNYSLVDCAEYMQLKDVNYVLTKKTSYYLNFCSLYVYRAQYLADCFHVICWWLMFKVRVILICCSTGNTCLTGRYFRYLS